LCAALLDLEQAAESAVVIALEAGLVFVGGEKRFGVTHLEGIGLGDRVAAFVWLTFDALSEFGGLDVYEAFDAPVGAGQGVDEMLLVGRSGAEMIEIACEERVVFLVGLAGEDDSGGIHSMLDGVHGGAALAGLGLGSAAAGARGVGDGDCGGHWSLNFRV
jgi:hypothetical protein